ncbi:MAG: hypothetical protein ABIW76_06755 [Fibrobacteria bacterium]
MKLPDGIGGFFLRLAAAAGLTLLLAAALGAVYSSRIIPKKNLYKSETQFRSGGTGAETLICGDSHAAYDLNPEFLPGAFNYALPSETLEQTYFKLRTALPLMPGIKRVLLPLDLHTFSNYRKGQYTDIWYWNRFLSPRELSDLTGKSAAALWIYRTFPFIGNGEEFKTLVSGGSGTLVIRGWQRHTEDFSVDSEKPISGMKRATLHFPNAPKAIDSSMLDYLPRIIALAKAHRAETFLIKFPVTPQYKQAVDERHIDRAAYYREVEALAKVSGAAAILDYQDSISREPLFDDPDHLNASGAAVLSAKIANRLGISVPPPVE